MRVLVSTTSRTSVALPTSTDRRLNAPGMQDDVDGSRERDAAASLGAREVADLTEHDVGGDAREEAEHDRERDEARVAAEPEDAGGHHQYAGKQGEDDERLLPLRRAEALQSRACGQRRGAGRRDHHEAGVGGQPAEDRPREARVEAVHGVHPDEHRSGHAVRDAAHCPRHPGDRVPGEVLARDRQGADPGLEGWDDGRQPVARRRGGGRFVAHVVPSANASPRSRSTASPDLIGSRLERLQTEALQLRRRADLAQVVVHEPLALLQLAEISDDDVELGEPDGEREVLDGRERRVQTCAEGPRCGQPGEDVLRHAQPLDPAPPELLGQLGVRRDARDEGGEDDRHQPLLLVGSHVRHEHPAHDLQPRRVADDPPIDLKRVVAGELEREEHELVLVAEVELKNAASPAGLLGDVADGRVRYAVTLDGPPHGLGQCGPAFVPIHLSRHAALLPSRTRDDPTRPAGAVPPAPSAAASPPQPAPPRRRTATGRRRGTRGGSCAGPPR